MIDRGIRIGVIVIATLLVAVAVVVVDSHDGGQIADALDEPVLPDASADGVLAFSCLIGGDTYDICVTNPATGDMANITATPDINETDPSWSPDGQRIIAASWASGGNNLNVFTPGDAELVTIDVSDLSDPGPMTPTGIKGFAPAWGPDGLAFARFAYDPPFHNRAPIEIVLADYSELRNTFRVLQPISLGGNMWSDPAWSPTGDDLIASFRKGQPMEISAPAWGELYRLPPFAPPVEGSFNLVVGGLDPGAIRSAREGGAAYLEGSYNPEGDLIVFVQCGVIQLTGNCTSASRRLSVMPRDGATTGAVTTLTDAGDIARNPVWSPTGGYVAYGSNTGIRIVDVTTGERSAVIQSSVGDTQPNWRPVAGASNVVATATGLGRFTRSFTEADDVHVISARVPDHATVVRSCVFDAVALTDPPAPATSCFDNLSPAPLTATSVAADSSNADLAFGPLPPGRFRALVEFDGSTERYVTDVFTVSCFGGSCDIFPRLALAADLNAFADRLETMTQVFQAACMSIQITQQILSTSRTVTNLLLAPGAVAATVNVGLNQTVSAGLSVSLGVVIDQFGNKLAKGAWSGFESFLDTRTEQDALKDQYYAAPPGATEYRTATANKINEADRRFKAGLTKTAAKLAAGVVADKVFEDHPKLQEAYNTAVELYRDPICGPFVDQNVKLIAAARALAVQLGEVAPLRRAVPTADVADAPTLRLLTPGSPDPALDGGNDTGGDMGLDTGRDVPATMSFLATPDVDGPTPTAAPGTDLPPNADTDRGYEAIIDAVPAVADLLAVMEPLVAADPDARATMIGDATTALDTFRSWTNMLPSLGNETVRSAIVDGIAADAPLADQADLDALAATQALLAAGGLTPESRQALLDGGATDEQIDMALARLAALDITPLTTTSAGDVDSQLESLSSDIVEISARLSNDLRVLRGALSEAPLVDHASAVTEVDVGVGIELPVFDPQGDFVDVEVVTAPAHGQTNVAGDAVLYVPDPGFLGIDTFTYRATDGTNTSDVATVTVEVKRPAPSPTPDQYGMRQGETLVVPAPGVLTNDISPRLPLTAELVSPPAGGLVTLTPGGGLTISAPDTAGEISFTYRASYPGSAPSAPVTVTVDVVAVQGPPVASPDSVTTSEDSSIVIEPLANDGDPDGDPLTLTGVTRPANGNVNCVVAGCTYTPHPQFNGLDRFEYTVADGTGRRSVGLVSITVNAADDASLAVADLLSFDAGTPGVVDVLANDSHPDGVSMQFVSATGTTNGSLSCTAVGVCTYTPADATVVADQATYRIRDERGIESIGTITIRRFAAYEEIAADGPLLYIVNGSSLACAVDHDGDSFGAFFADFGCGTLLASGGTLYGPATIAGSGNPPQPRTTFTRRSQTAVGGTGAVDDPFSVTTQVEVGATGIQLSQTDTYVDGEESYRTDVTLRNTSPSAQTMTLYRAGDCVVADDDEGLSTLDPTTGAATCQASIGDRIIRWDPITPGSSGYAGDADAMWAAIATQQPFADECLCTEPVAFDNGAGLSWTVTVDPGQVVTLAHRTVFAPFEYEPLVVTMTADVATVGVNGLDGYTITIANPNTTTPVVVGELVVALPPGFSHVADTTTGDLTTDPVTLDGFLRWAAPFSVAEGGTRTVHIDVTTASEAGTYLAAADANAPSLPVTPTGFTAPITLVDNIAPAARPAVSGDGYGIVADGSASFDPDGTIVEYRWTFGDGTSATGAAPSHTFATAGTYDVELTVVDDAGATETRAVRVLVLDPNASPVAAIGSDDQAVAAMPVELDGSASTDDGEIVEWLWDFGDGTTGSGPRHAVTYPSARSYTVRLTVTDDRGAANSTTHDITVTEPANVAPTAAFVPVVDDLTVAFDGGAATDIDGPDGLPVNWAWDFGDGVSATGRVAAHAYTTDGTYDVTLTVTDDRGATDRITRAVGVGDDTNRPPNAALSPGGFALVVDLDGTLSGDSDGDIVSYEWDLGDEVFASGPTARRVFPGPGRYVVSLLVFDNDGAPALQSLTLDLPLPAAPTDTTTTTTDVPDTTTTTTADIPDTTGTTVVPTTTGTQPPGTTSPDTTSPAATTSFIPATLPGGAVDPAAGTMPPLDPILPSTGGEPVRVLQAALLVLLCGLAVVLAARRAGPRSTR